MPERRFVMDANLIVSAMLLKQSAARQAFDKGMREAKLLLSSSIVTELDTVVRRKKFDKYLDEDERLQFLAALISEAELVEITETITECRDPKDNKYLELAISGAADCLISGDDDLLTMNPFRGVAILSPRTFLDQGWLSSL